MQDLAARMCLRHDDKFPRSIEPHRFMSQRTQVEEVAAGAAPEIQDRIGRLTLYRIEQGRIILADIVVPRTGPEGSCEPIVICNRRPPRRRLAADIGFGRQMHEKHAGRAADRASAMAATADIVGKEYFAAAASVLLPIAGFNFECTGKYDEQLTPRGWMPVLMEAFRHLRHHRALRRQNGGAADGIAESVGRCIVDRYIDLDKLRCAIGCRSKANNFHQGSPNTKLALIYLSVDGCGAQIGF